MEYVTNAVGIRKLVHSGVKAENDLASTRGLYFRYLIGTTQARYKPGENQVEALEKVHLEFYAVVLDAVQSGIALDATTENQALERNRRSNFARSAYGTIKRWLKVKGHDLMSLVPATVTKLQLSEETPVAATARKITAEKAQKRVFGMLEKVLLVTRALAQINATEARSVLDAAMNKLAQELFAASPQITTDVQKAVADHVPVRVGKTVFWPTETQVIRQQKMRRAA